ncbi:MAG: ABC transporter permease [Alteromonadaceae bacterium]|nr:ABC transporter permease [Alteromonadaceae bacterium]
MFTSPALRISLSFIGVAGFCLFFADMAISSQNPWREMGRLALGLLTPDLFAVGDVGTALVKTIAFAIVGVTLGCGVGFLLALGFDSRFIRLGCAFVRAIHELFWALIFLQFFGFHPLTGVLAIAIPYAGIFAKVFAEILENADPLPEHVLPAGSGRLSAFVFGRVAVAWPHLVSYTAYRLECGLRSSAILGFVGLPTLGFYLESSFSQGYYSQVGALLLLFFILIGTLRIWARPRLIPVYVALAPFMLGSGMPIAWQNAARFFTQDIVPSPLRDGEGWEALWDWLASILLTEALPGLWNTLVLTQIALVGTAVIALCVFPLISRHFGGPKRRLAGHALLVVARSTPEYMLAYILLQLWGPSMLPAVVALALHNGAIIGHLIGRQSNEISLRPDSASGLNRYGFELVPRVYGGFLAFLFYRWEVILRESAILGILGVATLGFYVDSAIQEIRFDRAMVLILVTALLNIAVDAVSRRLRKRIRAQVVPTC